jgi:hypothetical protein
MSAANCVVKIVNEHGVEHSVRVRAESVYEAAIIGLARLEKVGWESYGKTGWAVVEIHEEPTIHKVHVGKMLGWVKSPGRVSRDEIRKQKLRALLKVKDPQRT